MSNVLIVEDDPQFGRLLERKVARLGLTPLRASNLPDARRLFSEQPIRLVILDRELDEGHDGLSFCLELKKDPRTRAIPVVVLTGLDGLPAQLKSYRFGADLFLTKEPDALDNLGRFLTTFLERLPYKEEAAGKISWSGVTLDLAQRLVTIDGNEHRDVTPRLFDLLALLVARQGQLATRESIIKRLWDRPVRDKDIDVLVHRLKEQLPALSALIQPVRGQGYRLSSPSLLSQR